MTQLPDVSFVFNTFANLLDELEFFAEVNNLKLAIDRKRNVYLIGTDFQVQLQCNFAIAKEVATELRQIIAQRCPRIPPSAIDLDPLRQADPSQADANSNEESYG